MTDLDQSSNHERETAMPDTPEQLSCAACIESDKLHALGLVQKILLERRKEFGTTLDLVEHEYRENPTDKNRYPALAQAFDAWIDSCGRVVLDELCRQQTMRHTRWEGCRFWNGKDRLPCPE